MLVGEIVLQGLVAAAMAFSAYPMGVESRKGHGRDVAYGSILAVVGTGISYFLSLLLAQYFFPQSLMPYTRAVSAALSATDPVAVTALTYFLLKGASHFIKRLGIILETESLFNDPLALILFLLAIGQEKEAVQGLFLSLLFVLIIIAASYTALRIRGRHTATVVRKSTTILLIAIGAQYGAALITLSVIANFVIGVLEAPYHNESHEQLDRNLFQLSIFALTITILVSAVEIIAAAIQSPFMFIAGAGFMILLRLLARTLFVGFIFRTWRGLAFGGGGAIGVAAIGVVHFQELGIVDPAGFLAGAAVASMLAFFPLTIKTFNAINRNQS